MPSLHVPESVLSLCAAAKAEGGRALLVGGCVRDHFLERELKDWDIEVYGVVEDSLVRMLRGLGVVNAVGKSFGVYKLTVDGLELDVSMPRRDSNAGPGHRGIHVEGDPWMSPREAARRRDLTVNAMMLDPLTGELLDPWRGQEDLSARRLRAVDEQTFLEDPLRALRALQFAARFEMRPDEELIGLCAKAGLDELPAERIQGEWVKLLDKGIQPSVGLRFARQAGILARVFPEVTAGPEIDSVVDRAAALRDASLHQGQRLAVMLGAWLHGEDGPVVSATLDRLWLHTWQGYALRTVVESVVATLDDPVHDAAALRWLSTRTELAVALRVRHAVSGVPTQPVLDQADELGILHEKPTPLLLGRHLPALGVKPGPAMGKILKSVYAQQLDGSLTNLEQATEAARILVDEV